jgi:hypothetical protein
MYIYLLGLAFSNLCVLIMAIPALMSLTSTVECSERWFSVTRFDYIDCFDSKLTDKWQFYNRFRPFFPNYINIFQKTEIQTVILRCLNVLNINWFKSYDTKSKFFHLRFLAILQKKTNFCFLRFCILCHNFSTN